MIRTTLVATSGLLGLFAFAMLSQACSSDSEKPAGAPTTQSEAGADAAVADTAPPAPACDPYVERTTPTEVVIGPTSLEASLLATINGAKTSLDVMAVEITHKPLAVALVEAKKRNVAVRVIVDRGQAAALVSALGAEAVHEAPKEVTHGAAKIIVADGAKAFVSSADLTESAMTKERNYGVYVTEAEDLTVLKEIFDHDWNAVATPVASCKRIVSSPGSAHDLVVEHITSAEERVDLEVLFVSDTRVIDALKARAAAGVPVRVLLAGADFYKGNDTTGDALKAAGIEVRYFRNPNVHAKLVASERGALVGSHDLSLESLEKNREISVVVTDDKSKEALAAQFEDDWGKAALK